MFRTPTVDRLTRVHPLVPVVLFVPTIGVLFALALGQGLGVGSVLLLAAAGWAFWGLVEYWVHRIVFHIEPEQGFGARLHWMVHGVHHDHPNDPLRLVMPPAVSVPGNAVFVLVFVALFGVGSGLAVGVGFVTGYLVYDVIHHALHHHRPRTRLGRRMRELHMRHHFQDDTRGYGISAPWWDRAFGTAPERPGARPR
jgi:sterol desaturase/sphingolipid hydroxylase (fatty acid hydroxylase superfamily)